MKKVIALLIIVTCSLLSYAQVGTSYSVNSFDRIENSIVADVTLLSGSSHSVRIIADADDLKEIDLEVESGTLRIAAKHNNVRWNKKQKIKIFLTFKKLSSITLNGVGNVVCKANIRTDKLELVLNGVGDINFAKLDVIKLDVQLNGSGDIALQGNAKHVNYNINGAGDISAVELKATDASAHINGAGDLNLFVSRSLRASVVGVGDISYKGNPSNVNVKSSGVGEVSKY